MNFKELRWFHKIMEFAQALLAEFHESHEDAAGNCLIFVGHPAGWPADTVESYRRYLALLGPSVYLLPESQSALVHVRDVNRGLRDEGASLLDNVLVIDIGSSTTDVTVVEDLVPRNIPVGTALGCKQIDQYMATVVKSALAANREFTAALRADGGEDLLLLACRRAKEAQFAGHKQDLRHIKTSGNPAYEFIAHQGFGWLKAHMEIDKEVLQPGGWADKFTGLLTQVRQYLARPPQAIILTGGGSRMPFVRQRCEEAFPGIRILPEPGQDERESGSNPSLSVARGLASAGCQRVRVARFRRDVHAIVTSEDTSAEIRRLTDRAFSTIKASLMPGDVTGQGQIRAAGAAAGRRAADELNRSISDYLVPRALQVCETYGMDSTRFGIRLELPPLVANDLVARIAAAGTYSFNPKLLQYAAGRVTIQGMKWAWAAALRRPRPDPVWLLQLGALAALACLAWAAEAGINQHDRQKAAAMLREATLPAEAAEKIAASALAEITALMGARASAVERFVT